MLNWKYHNVGRKVGWFVHGGNRAFYDEPTWVVGEMSYVSRYHTHRIGEARRFAARFRRTCRYKPTGSVPEFLSYGSLRHQRWVEEGRKNIKSNGGAAKTAAEW